jgi:putative heme iron utilization protein
VREDEQRVLAALIRSQRTAALGTLYRGMPYVSLVLCAEAADFGAFYIHVSGLAIHTQNLRADARAGLMISQPDAGTSDPQTRARVSLQALAAPILPDSPDYPAARARYVARFPESRQTFELADFELFCLTPLEGRFVAGFGRIFNLSPSDLRAASSLPA